jgi:hypothetical protein
MAEPYCLAMVLCDGTHRDPTTGKFTILGTFDSFASPSFPAQIALCIYFAVTDGIGVCKLRIQFVEAKAGPIDAAIDDTVEGRVFRIESELAFDNPLAVAEQAVGIDFMIPAPGVYLCELWANDEMLMQRRLVARKVEAVIQ